MGSSVVTNVPSGGDVVMGDTTHVWGQEAPIWKISDLPLNLAVKFKLL